MKNKRWIFYRFKAMDIREVTWRTWQKGMKIWEKRKYYKQHTPVTDMALSGCLQKLQPFADNIILNWENERFELFTELDLFGSFSYEACKKNWNDGFQTIHTWPERECSFDIPISQRVDIGDIRTNWELNRHYQFSALAKNYYATGKVCYLEELEELFQHWNEHNLFLHGVQWISGMEIGIRVNSWIFTYCFLEKGFLKWKEERKKPLLDQISSGIQTMITYIIRHYSRFSSANNHLIVEAYATGMAGIFYRHQPWVDLAVRILTEELTRQSYSDGVNREMSLHYQAFVMEAYGILMLMMRRNGISIPPVWTCYLEKMSGFVADCCGEHGEKIVFGDNDEGKLLDLNGRMQDYYQYVLDLMSCVLKKRYTKLAHLHENINWLLKEEELCICHEKELYEKERSKCYREGGCTILRSVDRRILIGIDHGELGFGSIAAHGHADALSFQMFVDGNPVFVDPGTYNYHVPQEDRDYFRRTANHNTVMVGGQDQSEMLGPFLWGRKAHCQAESKTVLGKDVIWGVHDGYHPVFCKRIYEFNKKDRLLIRDIFPAAARTEYQITFMLSPQIYIIKKLEDSIWIGNKWLRIQMIFPQGMEVFVTEEQYSFKYNHKVKTQAVRLKGDMKKTAECVVQICVGEKA